MSEKSIMKKTGKSVWLSLICVIIAVPIVLVFSKYFGDRHYYISGVIIIVLAMLPFFAGFESRRPEAREIVTLAVMCAIAVASRAAFIMLPSFKPMVGIIMITGMAFGPAAGFLTGAMSGFISNFIFGQGPWTPWQMFAFGVAGFITGLLANKGVLKPVVKTPEFMEKASERGSGAARVLASVYGRLPLALYGFFVIMLITGPLLDTCTLFTMTTEVTKASAAAVYLAGIPFNAVHGVATLLTLFFLSRPMLDKLDRIKVKYGMMQYGFQADAEEGVK